MPDAYTNALQSTLLAAQPGGVGVPGIAAPTLAPAPVAAPAPAKGLEGLKAGWFDFLKGVRENPEQQQAFLRMGLQLLQPVQPGQTTAGHVSQAALQGMDYLTQAKALQTQREREKATAGLEERKVVAMETGVGQAQEELKLKEQAQKDVVAAAERAHKLQLMQIDKDAQIAKVKSLADSGALTQKQLWDRAVELAGKVYEADRPFMGNEAFELKYPKGAIALAQDYFTRMGGQLLPVVGEEKKAGEEKAIEPSPLGLKGTKGTKENPHILKTQQDYADVKVTEWYMNPNTGLLTQKLGKR